MATVEAPVAGLRPPLAARHRASPARRRIVGSSVTVGLLMGTVAVSSWNGVHVPLFSHFFYLFTVLSMISLVVFRPPRGVGVLPGWLLVVGGLLAVVAIVDQIAPPSPIALSQVAYQIASSGALYPPTLAGFGSNLGNLLRVEMSLLVFPCVMVLACRDLRDVRRIADAWLLGTTVSALIAVSDAVDGADIGGRLTGQTPSIEATGRQVGLTVQANHLGLSCLLVIPMAVIWLSRPGRAHRAAGAGIVAILVGAILVSGSRGAAAGAVFAALATVIAAPGLRRHLTEVLGLGVVAIVVIVTLSPTLIHGLGEVTRLGSGASGTGLSDAGRALLFNIAEHEFVARPITGFGLSTIEVGNIMYVEWLSAGGVVALGLFAFFCVRCGHAGISATQRVRDGVMYAALVSLASWLIVGAVENQISDGYLYVAPALLLSISALVDVRPRRPTYGGRVVSRPRWLDRSRAVALRQPPAVGSSQDGWLGGWFRDSGILLVSQVMLTATATLVMILLSRGLSKYQFGVFASFLGFSQALSFVIDVGLPLWLLRETIHSYAENTAAAAKKEVYERLWHSAFTITGIAAVLATIVALTAMGLGLTPSLAVAEAGFIIYVALLAISLCFETDLRARRRPGLVVVATMVEKSTILAGVLVVLAMHWGVPGIAAATVLGGCGRVAFSYSRTLWRSGIARPHIGRGSLRVLRGSAPFAGNTASLSFFPRIDTPVVALISVVSASYFTLGFQVTTTAILVPAIASATLLPFLHGKDGTARRRVAAVLVMGALGVAAAVGGWLLSPFVIPLMFGARYHVAVRTVQIMWLGMPFAFITYGLLTLMYAIGHEHAVARAIWVPSLLGTGLVVAGALLWGAPGAAGGNAARFLLQAVVVALVARRGFAAARASEDAPGDAAAG